LFSLTGLDLARFLLGLTALLVGANLLGYVAERLTIPRVIGEVTGGLIFGPTLLGYFFPSAFHWMFLGFPEEGKLFGLVYQLGLILLMFTSGLKFQARFAKSDARLGAALVIGSTVVPFLVGWGSTYLFNAHQFLGTANNLTALKIVVAISIAVTSIPVISKILFDLGIIHSRFAKLVITVAGVHDIIIWVALAVASGIVSSGNNGVNALVVMKSLGVTFAFLLVCLFVVPWILKRVTSKRANFLFRASFLGYFLFILFALSDIAGYLNVDVMYGALLAGIATKLTLPDHLFQRIEASVREISFALFIPVYFAIVGLQLDLARHFDVGFFILYLLFATAVQGITVFFTCRLVRNDPLTSFNLAAAMNARGGPGIVLSTVAYSLGIINEEFFCILVVLALTTSWMAGAWLRFIVQRGKRLMPGDEHLVLVKAQEEANFEVSEGKPKPAESGT
jgi:Kef-type K+ transport system membrane component KefB